ncbi:MAG TPA: HNH endonuclease [Rhizomicrobium sp.]|nr:HNH endonuclease [Rhizomicrobium sp.]
MRDGWPGLARATTQAGKTLGVALHVSKVTSHSRAPYERRFQNPANGEVVAAPAGHIPILLGYAQIGVRPLLVAVDGLSRLGREARFSILFHQDLLTTAAQNGWAEYISGTDERIFAMYPKLFPIFIEALQSGAYPATDEMISAVAASGIAQEDTSLAADRARRVGTMLVRSSAFRKHVCDAYDRKCAMCGLGIDMVEGAHILPASAPNSPDKVWNGVALCPNHHAAFDKHYIWVDPGTRAIQLRSDILKIAETDNACEVFTRNTRKFLSIPKTQNSQPRAEMFTRRYEHYDGLYSWPRG